MKMTPYSAFYLSLRESLLPRVAAGHYNGSNEEGMTVVAKQVFASPVLTAVNLERPDARSGMGSSRPCYPNLCFSVENFDDAFEGMVSCLPMNGGELFEGLSFPPLLTLSGSVQP